MRPKRDNYAIQAEDARVRFLTYDQTAMPAEKDENHLCLPFCGCDYRISRADGHIFRRAGDVWLPADSHGEALTLFDYLCDARPDRAPANAFATIAALGSHVHRQLATQADALDLRIDRDPGLFRAACAKLGCAEAAGGDLCFRMNLFPDLPVLLRFWHSDEDFPPKLDILWDRNALQFLRYETLWYAAGLLRQRLAEAMGGQ